MLGLFLAIPLGLFMLLCYGIVCSVTIEKEDKYLERYEKKKEQATGVALALGMCTFLFILIIMC